MLPIFQTLRVDAARAILRIPEYPEDSHSGRGIVVCAGGPTYFVQAFVTIRLLRKLGCKLPIEVWHRDAGEMTSTMRDLLESCQAKCVNAQQVARDVGMSRLPGWAIKPFAILHSRFQEVLFLDSDSLPTRDPEYLFSDPSYQATGSLFWTDRFRGLSSAYSTVHPKAWSAMNVAHRDEPECESGQLMVDKSVVWRELNLCLYFNLHADSYYRFLYGDKDTFRFAWHRLGRAFNTVPFGPSSPPNFRVLYQLDPSGNVIFQHRARAKWNVRGGNRSIPGFQHEASCLEFLGEVDQVWDRILEEWQTGGSEEMRALRQSLANESEHYCFVGRRFAGTATFVADGHLSSGVKQLPTHWQIVQQPDDTLGLALMGDRAAPVLLEQSDGGWLGQRVAGRRESIFLIPRRAAARFLNRNPKRCKKTRPRDSSASPSAATGIVSYECELLASGQPPASDLIVQLEGGSLASGQEPKVASLQLASERPSTPSWSGDSRPGSASAVQLEMFADTDVASAASQESVTTTSDLSPRTPSPPSGSVKLTNISTAFQESMWSSGEPPVLSPPALPHGPHVSVGAAESLSSYTASLWSGDELFWSGSDSAWSGSDCQWSGSESFWSGAGSLWSGGEGSWSGGGEPFWTTGDAWWSGGGSFAPLAQQHWSGDPSLAGPADILPPSRSSLPTVASGSAAGSHVKIYGLPRTCTNLVAHLIRHNFKAQVYANGLGWKHGPNLWREGDQINDHPLKFVICVKHPYAWLASFYRFEVEGHGLSCSFPSFVRGTCMTYPNRNPIDRYNLLVRMWLGLAVSSESAQVVRAETIQADQLGTMETLERQLSFRRRHRNLRGQQRRVGPDEQIRRRDFDPSYYQGQQFLSHYDSELLAFVNQRIDHDLMQTLQYRLLDEMPLPSRRESS